MNKLPKTINHQPMIVAWNEFKNTPEYEALKRSLENPNAVDSALWSVFESGWVSRRVVINELMELNKEERRAMLQALGEQSLPWYKRLVKSWKFCR